MEQAHIFTESLPDLGVLSVCFLWQGRISNHFAAQGKLKTGSIFGSHSTPQDGSVETCYNTNLLKDVLCALC